MRNKHVVYFLVLFLIFTNVALPCGGPSYVVIDSPLVGLSDYLTDMTFDNYDDYDFSPVKTTRFLYPFYLANPKQFQNLWNQLYRYDDNAEDVATSSPQLAEFDDAIKNGDLSRAYQLAEVTIQKILDLPLYEAQENNEVLKRALEFVELKSEIKDLSPNILIKYFVDRKLPEETKSAWPRLQAIWETIKSWFGYQKEGSVPEILKQAERIRLAAPEAMAQLLVELPQSPRRATMEFVILKEAMRTQIPDGYLHEIQSNVTSQQWQELEGLHRQWLAQYAAHPLADLVQLSLVHLYYLKGESENSWKILLDMYPKHQLRLLAEMRFLLYQTLPPLQFNNPIIDPQLLAALIPSMTLTEEEWNQSWQISELNLSQPWGMNMQERLLQRWFETMGKSQTLPQKFPKLNQNTTRMWGGLRALILVKAGQWAEADAQLQTLKLTVDDAVLNSLQARIDLHEGRIVKAILDDHLQVDDVSYLIRVVAEDDVLNEIIRRQPDSDEAADALLTRAIRFVAKDNWQAAAELLNDENWRQAAALQKDKTPTGLLNWAKFLQNNDNLFFGYDREWYIAISYRYKDVLRKEQTDSLYLLNEDIKIKNYLMNSSESYLALKAYTAWLNQAKPQDAGYAHVVKESDKLFNSLINRANWSADFWLQVLDKSEEAQIIRAAGKNVK